MSPLATLEPVVDLTPVYLTPAQVAEMLQLSEKSVYRLAKSEPTMPMIKLGAGRNASVRFPRERLMRWLRDREQGAPRMRRPVLSSSKSTPDREGRGA
jgi:excisionase family DNA binding protein